MSRLTTSLAIGAMAGLALTGLAAPAAAKSAVQPETHKAAYWEAYWAGEGLDVTCEKMEYGDGMKLAELDGAYWMYLKAGQAYEESRVDVTMDKDVSFVIRCYGGPRS
ncbi:hypothetical protein N866_14985 [Actinotalea ferrariae CF5-4]|uniref:Uncharacterized protein n=1 Tax=Actinotalea ferrariae CF5-4 TaxID=948458 RepID=A0A021VSQ8_9CELL|nr:hypothetical protein [Actinotalea ferrariae]EYR64158.1 hypothetical protein N866_14985 [Actinotalea ferrariae CF5-4]